MSDDYSWRPATAAQKAALDSNAKYLFFGGSAGSLKSETLLMDAAQERDNPNLRAIIFRSSFREMADLIDKTRRLYPPLGAEYVGSPKWTWTFPSGAQILFGYMKTDDDWRKYLGPRFSFIGIDESTLHSEKQVRNILGRLGTTDRNLRERVRFTSNPGNVGAPWHQEIFLRGHCPVHNPIECAAPGTLYTDRYWPSDGKKIKGSCAFIPGKLSDHNLLGPEYRAQLDEMHSGQAAAMRDGCWCTLEGAYFPFLNKDMVRETHECDIQPWFSHFIAIDYGFGQSNAAAGLFVRTPPEVKQQTFISGVRRAAVEDLSQKFPNGRIRQIGEIVVPMSPVDEFINKVIEGFIAPSGDEQRRSVIAIFLDPANFNPSYDIRQGTGGHAVSDQMNLVLEPWDLSVQMANNKRGDGWQLVHRMLRDREFEFTERSPKTFEAIRTRMIDPEKYLDIVKEKGEPKDDLADMLRYALYTFINPAEKPRELRLQEAVKGLDITSASIRWQQTADLIDAEEAPIRFGSRRLGMGRRR